MIGKIIYYALVIYQFMVIMAVFKSFLLYFSRGDRFSFFISKLQIVDSLTDPYLNIFRKILPPLNGLDFSPMLGLFILQIIESLVKTKLMTN